METGRVPFNVSLFTLFTNLFTSFCPRTMPPRSRGAPPGTKRKSTARSEGSQGDMQASKGGEQASKRAKLAPTAHDIIHDALTPVANDYWAPGAGPYKPFDGAVIESIYCKELQPVGGQISTRTVMLELSSYLEK